MLREHHREAYGVEQVAHFLGDRCVRSRTPRVVGRCDRTFAVASRRPALIGKTIEAIVVTENEVVE